jgi:hypothetical protein
MEKLQPFMRELSSTYQNQLVHNPLHVEVDQVRERLKVTDARSCDSYWTQQIIWFRFSEEGILDESQSQLYTSYGLDRSIHPGYKHIQHFIHLPKALELPKPQNQPQITTNSAIICN